MASAYLPREGEVRRAGLAPHEIRIRRVGEPARDRLLDAVADPIESFGGALAGQERLVVLVDVRGDQVGRFGVGARQQDRRHAHDVGCEPRGIELLHRLLRRHQHLSAHMAALLDRRQLIFEVHAGRARLDHRLHELEGVQHAAETRLRVGHDRREPVDVVLALGVVDLVGAHERIVDPAHDGRHAESPVERLVGIHLAANRWRPPRPASPRDRSPAGPP